MPCQSRKARTLSHLLSQPRAIPAQVSNPKGTEMTSQTASKPDPWIEPPTGLGRRANVRRGAWFAFLVKPCPRHGARAGEPCWVLPPSYSTGGEVKALCGARIGLTKRSNAQAKRQSKRGAR